MCSIALRISIALGERYETLQTSYIRTTIPDVIHNENK